MDAFQTKPIIINRVIVVGVFVFADVDTERTETMLRTIDIRAQRIDTEVIKTKAIDDRFVFLQTEQTRLRITQLRTRRDSADLDKAETHFEKSINRNAILVESSSQTNRITQRQTRQRRRQ